MPKGRFIETRRTNNAGVVTIWENGKVYEMPQASLERWLARNAIERVPDDTPVDGNAAAQAPAEGKRNTAPPAAGADGKDGGEKQPTDGLRAVHVGFGKWDVLGPGDVKLNTEALTKEQAQAWVKNPPAPAPAPTSDPAANPAAATTAGLADAKSAPAPEK